MQVQRKPIPYSHYAAARLGAENETAWFRLRAGEREFFVSNEVEAFAVIARHDVDDIEAMTIN
jgi:hypothetical protein